MIRRLAHDDSGAVAVIFAIVFLVIVGVAALAVDVGYWYTAKRQLQSAADAAALAACNELAEGVSIGAVQGVAIDYATRNFTAPLEPSSSRVATFGAENALSHVEASSGWVRVTTETNARVFLSHWLLNRGTTLIRAQAVASLGYVHGARAPAPWALKVLNIGEASGRLGGQPTGGLPFSKGTSDYWSRTFPAGYSGGLDLSFTNSQNYMEEYAGLVAVGAIEPGSTIDSVTFNKTTFTSGKDSTLEVTVQLSSALQDPKKHSVAVSLGGTVATLSLHDTTTNTYKGSIAVGTTSKPYESKTVTVSVLSGQGNQTIGEPISCGVLLRSSSYIIQDIDYYPAAVKTGQAAEQATVRVKTLSFVYDTQYQVKFDGGGGDAGDYQAVALGTIDHTYCDYGGAASSGPGGSEYEGFIAGNEAVVHLGDYIDVEPGNMTGPTESGLKLRLPDGPDFQTLQDWETAGRPETKQILIIPILERYAKTVGRKPLVVVGFVTLFLEPNPNAVKPDHKKNSDMWVDSEGRVTGTFIEWVDSGYVVGDNPSGGLAVRAVHLTDSNLQF